MISLETTDIFRGAFLLASGGDLAEVRVRNAKGHELFYNSVVFSHCMAQTAA